MHVEVAIVNAFTRNDTGGNPAGVVLDADNLGGEQKLAIARVIGLSETAFVSSSDVAGVKLEFFTPTRQIAHCGHATIAAFSWLVQQQRMSGERSSKETIDGIREIVLAGDTVFMEQRAPRYVDVTAGELMGDILPALNLPASALDDRASPVFVNTGNTFLVLPLDSRAALAAIRPDSTAIRRISDRHDLVGFYPFTLEADDGFDAEARMFAPRYGIDEEAATGMAAGPLAAFLHDRLRMRRRGLNRRFRISQGALMASPSPSEILVDVEAGPSGITRLLAGGRAALSETRRVSL